MLRSLLFTTVFAFGCSGSTFEVATETPDTAAPVDAADTNVPETCTTPNACGGCATLDHAVGDPCGVCKVGSWKCDGMNTMLCDDPFSGPLPETACGTCKTVKLTCGPDGKSAICPTDDANACGGCGAIANYPGTKCGTCKTLEYKCTVDKSGTICPGDDHNGCMGCTMLTNKPGNACGLCGGGSYVCDGTDKTKCNDPVTTPAPGTACGICSKSTYVCSSDKSSTACALPDDRTAGTDSFYTALSSSIWTLSGADGNAATIGIGFTSPRIGAITSVTLGLIRYEANASYPLPGTLRVQLIKGAPTTTPASSDILATNSLSGESVSDTMSPVPITFTGVPQLPAGQRYWIRVVDISDKYNYGIVGAPASGPVHLSLHYLGTSGYAEYTSYDPYLTVSMNGCY